MNPLTPCLMGISILIAPALIAPPPAEPPGAKPPSAPAPGVEQAPREDYSGIAVPELGARLAMLDPARPMGYFELAEEVGAEDSRAARALGRRLFTLAFELDRSPGGPGHLGQSACLGLASLTSRPGEQRWLAAIAAVIESDRAPGVVLTPPPIPAPVVDTTTGLQLATAIALVRGGDGRRASNLLRRPAVSRALDAYARVLEDRGSFGVASGIRYRAETYPFCPECKNKRVLNRPAKPGEPARAEVCALCNGVPGQVLSQGEFLTQIATEAALVRGIHRLWSSQALADGGDPLRDPDPADLAAWQRVDATLSVFRDGRWASPSGGK